MTIVVLGCCGCWMVCVVDEVLRGAWVGVGGMVVEWYGYYVVYLVYHERAKPYCTMLSKVLFVCLFALSGSDQNCIVHTADIGEGRLLATNDRVLGQYRENIVLDNNVTSFVYDKEGDVALTYCHDRICEDRTETLIDAGACGGGSCALDVCTSRVPNRVLDQFSTFIYGANNRVNKVNCYDYGCVDKNVTTIAYVPTSKVSCDVYSRKIFVSTAASGAYMLWGCDRPCTTPVHYFTDGVFPFSIFLTRVVARNADTPLVGFVARNYFQGVFHYDLYLLNCAYSDCYYPVFLLVDEDLYDPNFALHMNVELFNQDEKVRVIYSKWENGMFCLKLFACTPEYVLQCRDPVMTIIDTGSSGFSKISTYYDRFKNNLVITYVHGGAVKKVDCYDSPCNNRNMTVLFPVGGAYGGVSMLAYYKYPSLDEQLHVVFEDGDGRIKYFSRTCGVVTPYPSLHPIPRPTGVPSGVSMAPTPAPTSWSEGPTRGPTDVPTTGTPTTEVPTEVPTGMPTGHPVVSPLVEEGEQRRTKWLEENLTYGNIAWTVVNGLSLVCLGVSWCVGKLKEREVASIEDAIMTIE